LNRKPDTSPVRYWRWMLYTNSTTAAWLSKRLRIHGRAQPPSLWIRSNGFTVSRPTFPILENIVKDSMAHTRTAGGFPWLPKMTRTPPRPGRNIASRTFRIVPMKPAVRGLGWSKKYSRPTRCDARAAAACASSPLLQSPAWSTASCAISEARARKRRILLNRDRLPPKSQALCNNSESAPEPDVCTANVFQRVSERRRKHRSRSTSSRFLAHSFGFPIAPLLPLEIEMLIECTIPPCISIHRSDFILSAQKSWQFSLAEKKA